MAIAAVAALPALQNLSPAQALEFIEAAEKVAAKARSLTIKTAHAASLTQEEEYKGWAPLLLLMYRFWTQFLGPQVEFGLQTQIGLAEALNHFGASIDVGRMRQVLARVRKTVQPFKTISNPAASPLLAGATTIPADGWAVG